MKIIHILFPATVLLTVRARVASTDINNNGGISQQKYTEEIRTRQIEKNPTPELIGKRARA